MLRIHRAERADALVRGLADVLATPPDDPFTPDVVAVPSQGVERWIAQQLSATLGTSTGRQDGVCANVEFPSPRRLVARVLAEVEGIEPDEDPWRQGRMVWPLLDVIDRSAPEPRFATLGRHLGLLDEPSRGDEADSGRRVAVAQKLAGLFAAYGADRPHMVQTWMAGEDSDGAGAPLDADLAWQAEIWRRVRETIGVESPAERLDDACARLRSDPTLVDLPARLSLFGPTRLTTEQLRVLDALAAHRDVHLWLPHSSHVLWDRMAGEPANSPRRDDPTGALPQHPLVRSMARDAREMHLRLAMHASIGTDEYIGDNPTPTKLLEVLQRDIHHDRAPDPERHVDADDHSVQVHACHGRDRQVEVLREIVLGLLADDPTLEPRDIIVMCPDIESWAPLITASFGGEDRVETSNRAEATPRPPDQINSAHPGHSIDIRLADRSLRQTNPVLAVVAHLLDIVDGRLAAPDVLDLAAMPSVRRRFGFDDDALERIGDWVRESGVRWGLDAQHRRPYGLDGFAQNTWQAGLDRVLTGVAMTGDEPLGLALGLDDVDSTDIDLAGRLSELVARIAELTDRLAGEHALATWIDTLLDAVDMLTDSAPSEQWQQLHARRQLTDTLVAAGERTDARLRLSDVRALLARRLEGRPTRANFRTGHLTVATLVPMRSVPHRVVCLLGLDDGSFPRVGRLDGDDVLGRTPLIGERDPRSEDRQLFLDAVLAARDNVVITYTGADERTGALRPPAVPVGELLDTLDRTAAGPVRELVLHRHPLQPFDPRNFDPDSGPFSFDAAAYAGAGASLRERTDPGPFLSEPLDQPDLDVVELAELIAFLEHPARAFLRQRLQVSSTPETEEAADALPVEVAPLDGWQIGNRLLDARLAGTPAETATRAERLRGLVPPGQLGNAAFDPIVANVEALVAATTELRATPPETVEIATAVDGVRLVGAVAGVHGDNLVRVVYSRLAAKHRIRAWVQLLALAAARPDRHWTATTVGRARSGTATALIADIDSSTARTTLASLIEVYRRGLRQPLPMPPRTSCAYAERRLRSGPNASTQYAGKEWRSSGSDGDYGEFDDESHLLIWGDVKIDSLLTALPEGPTDEPHLLGELARRVWAPLLEAEVLR